MKNDDLQNSGLKSLSLPIGKTVLLLKIETLAREERRITSEILDCLHEIEAQMIYAELGFSSLWEFCVKHLKYSEGAAHRRISAMRLLKGLSGTARLETQEKIKSGSVSVTNLSLVHGFLKTEAADSKSYSLEEKASLVGSTENQSKRELEKKLAAIQPKIQPGFQKESKRVVSKELTEIKFLAREEFIKKLDRVKEVSAHAGVGLADLLERMMDEYLKKHDPMVRAETVKLVKAKLTKVELMEEKPKAPVNTQSYTPSTTEKITSLERDQCINKWVEKSDVDQNHENQKNQNSRYIPSATRATIWKKAEGKCTFTFLDSKTGALHQCKSKYGLEIEHRMPFALGGTNAPENLTLRCRAHNQLAARRVFGAHPR